MRRYTIQVLPEAEKDIQDYTDHIMFQYSMPITANRHKKELFDCINSLATYADSIQVSDKQDILRYGANARAVRYKKMLIIYTLHDTLVVVRAVVPAAMITR